MQLAIWDVPLTKCLETAAESLSGQIEKHSAPYCTELLRQRQVDIALLPVTTVLTAIEEFDIIPGGAISSWEYPFAWLHVHQGLQQAKVLKSAPGQKLEEFMTRVILKEHYGQKIQVTFDGHSDIDLVSGSIPLSHTDDPNILDLGQEWYELAQYPMVWGVYACLKEIGTDLMIQWLMELTKKAEIVTQEWGTQSELPESKFFSESLRLRMDDVTIAGLTSIRDYMYYYGMTEDLLPLPIFASERTQELPWWGQDTGQTRGVGP